MKNITSNKFFIPGFAIAVTLFVVIVLVFFRGGIPDDAVAVVDGEAITKADFNRTLKVFASQSQPNANGKPVLPDPPTFKNCVANKRKTAPKKTSDGDLKKQCKQDYETARDQIMAALIDARWYELEAADRGIKFSDAEVKARFTPLKQQTFPKEADYQKFLKSSGQTEADLMKLVRNQMYQEKIREKVSKPKQPTAKDVEEFYKKNQQQFKQPESRDLLVVVNSKKAKADAALAELKSGKSFAVVAKKYSEDTASKDSGGKMMSVPKGQFGGALDKSVYSAKKGILVGPIKTQFGFYLFKVTKITPASKQSLQKATPQIKQQLQSTNQQKAFDDFQKEFKETWKKKTECAEGFVTESCKNAPKKKGATGATGAK
ncbi:MAG: peptidyl-prolyl cis-trans isomerase [Actinobacteria bacterium]|nr:peptidyl-prolyl cis-trans isomerase [Actinomycetota bacterium]